MTRTRQAALERKIKLLLEQKHLNANRYSASPIMSPLNGIFTVVPLPSSTPTSVTAPVPLKIPNL
jgi:hypothetical protein